MLSLLGYLSFSKLNKGETIQRDVDGKEDEIIWPPSILEHSHMVTGHW